MQLSKNVRITKTANLASAATSAVDGTAVDTTGFQGVTFAAEIAVANAGNHLTVQQSDASNTGFTALDGAKSVCAVNGDVCVVDVKNPQKRYLRGVITRTASTASGALMAYSYGPSKAPVTHGSTVQVAAVVAPDEED